MALETVTYISDLNASNPVDATDLVSTLGAHARIIKSAVKTTFPNVAGAVSASDVELSYVHGVTSAVQTQLNAKGAIAGQTWTGTHDYSGAAVVKVPTVATTDSTTNAASTAQVQAAIAAAAMSASTPTVPADSGKVWTSTGSIGNWSNALNAGVMRLKDGTDATKLLAFSLSGLSTGTTRTITVPDKSGTLAMTSDLPAVFTSAEQTITAAGSLTIAHGLGVVPRLVMGYLKCVTAESGYSPGDVLCVPLGQGGAGQAFGVAVTVDSTNLNVRFGSNAATFGILNKTSGTAASTTNANWTFSLRAYA